MPKYRALYELYRDRVSSGVWKPGERLPSIREAAAAEGVGVNTVRTAYDLLEREGLAAPVERGGYFVTRRAALSGHAGPRACFEAEGLSSSQKIELILSRGGGSAGFALAEPDPDLLPIARLQRLFASLPPSWIGYGDMGGEPELRRRIVASAHARHGRLEPESILITNGATEALGLAFRAALKAGDVVAVESPTYYDFFRQLSAVGARILEVPVVPGRGMDLGLLEAAMRRMAVRMIVAQPNVQNPTGALMPDADKERLVALAARHGAALVQDDVYGELAFTRDRPLNLDAFGDYAGLIHISSFSKTLAPGLRIGWISSPGMIEGLSRAKGLSTLATNRPAQLAIAAYLGGSEYRRHLAAMKAALRARLDEYLAVLEGSLPDGSAIARPAGGCLLWVCLPPGTDASALFEAAAREGILFAPGELFSGNPFFGDHLRVNYGGRLTERKRAMLARIGELAGGLRAARKEAAG